jgi:hypothetical protein
VQDWLHEHADLRDAVRSINCSRGDAHGVAQLQAIVAQLGQRIAASGLDAPLPVPCERKALAAERAAARAAAIAEQEREAAALAEIGAGHLGSCDGLPTHAASSSSAAAADGAAHDEQQQQQQQQQQRQQRVGFAGA